MAKWCPEGEAPKHEPCTYGDNLRRLLNLNYDKSYDKGSMAQGSEAVAREESGAKEQQPCDAIEHLKNCAVTLQGMGTN